MKTWTTWLVAVAASAAASGCGQGGAGQGREGKLTMLTYNVHIGKGMNNKVDLARQGRVIARLAPDVVALQEIDRRTARSGGVDQFAELVRLTGMRGVYCKTLDYDGGEFGIALLSRWPIVEHAFHRLPLEKGNEQRYLIEATLALPAGAAGGPTRLKVLATHLDYGPDNPDRLAAARVINALAARGDGPAVLAGDFNDGPDGAAMKELLTQWTLATPADTPTFPADRPTRTLDYILFRPPGAFRVDRALVADESLASDHRPVQAVLRLGR